VASPVGHTLLGLALGSGRGASPRLSVAWLVFAIVAANAPDLDYLAGLLAGDLGRFHRGVSHSVFAGLLFGTAVGLAVRGAGRGAFGRTAVWAGLLYLSHIVIDLVGFDHGGRSGMPLLWPITDETVYWPWPFLPGLVSITRGTEVGTFLRSLASASNVRAVLVEILLLGPLALFAWRSRRRERARSRTSGVSD